MGLMFTFPWRVKPVSECACVYVGSASLKMIVIPLKLQHLLKIIFLREVV